MTNIKGTFLENTTFESLSFGNMSNCNVSNRFVAQIVKPSSSHSPQNGFEGRVRESLRKSSDKSYFAVSGETILPFFMHRVPAVLTFLLNAH